jgi:hypothetical protein
LQGLQHDQAAHYKITSNVFDVDHSILLRLSCAGKSARPGDSEANIVEWTGECVNPE